MSSADRAAPFNGMRSPTGGSSEPTYHRAWLLRTLAEKRKGWDDLQMVVRFLRLSAYSRMPGLVEVCLDGDSPNCDY